MTDSLTEILEVTDKSNNKFILAIAIARRVRKIKNGAPPLVKVDDPEQKPIETAIREIAEKKITFEIG